MLKIDYRLKGSGWAECTIHADGRKCEVSASYLSDALGKLVLAGVAVLAGAQSVSVGFDEEPGEYRWAIVMTDDGVVRVDMLEFRELWGNRPDVEGTLLMTFSCPPLEFGEAVYAAAEEVHKLHGLAGYKKRWATHDFPVAELDLLKSYILRWERNG
ncbi:hypothetical protein IA69_28735 [Massilia sp. JS1662]|nr:hypothetical protein [Massilia sp. JS1662]KGF78709.1 hypothetical protein IA69_28735 [Massilia sp. JS1662]